MWNTAGTTPDSAGGSNSRKYLLWVDGVGSYLVCLGREVTVGGPAFDEPGADVALLAMLSRRHATIVRDGEGYLVRAHAPLQVAGKVIHDKTNLADGYELQFGEDVRMRFRMPTALSTSARLEFLSDHRPTTRIDGVVLMDETCLLGPGDENHIVCRNWPGSVLLCRSDDALSCRSRLEIFVGTQRAGGGRPLADGDVVTGPDLRFRVEAVSSFEAT
jgi:hypothetical protein